MDMELTVYAQRVVITSAHILQVVRYDHNGHFSAQRVQHLVKIALNFSVCPGGWFIDRYSRVAVVRASALMGALGIGLIIFVDSAWVAGVSVVLWGLGASLGFPLTISAASDTGPDAPTRVSVVATTGYLAFLVGPPLLGYLGEHYGLRSAMLVVLALVILAAIVAKAVAKPDTKTQTAMENS